MKRFSSILTFAIAASILTVGCATGGGGGGPICGDDVCEVGEDLASCPTDCAPAICGDAVCAAVESSLLCAVDCYCGNGSCDGDEDSVSCALDCAGPSCGNTICDAGETSLNCPGDCSGPVCGNGTCDLGETRVLCPADCYVCGDTFCDPPNETAATCAADCSGTTCPNGICDAGETYATCPQDCTCGNGVCDAGETNANCPQDCPAGCSDPICDLWPQCNCAPDKCTINAQDQRECATAGSSPHGGTCSTGGDAECMAGAICLSDSLCRQFCSIDADCPGGAGAGCFYRLIDSAQNPIPGANMCTIDCNPLQTAPTSGCLAGYACRLASIDANNDGIIDGTLTICDDNPGFSTTTCTAASDCVAGYACAGTNECLELCRIGFVDCSFGTCNSWADPMMIGATEYGYCM